MPVAPTNAESLAKTGELEEVCRKMSAPPVDGVEADYPYLVDRVRGKTEDRQLWGSPERRRFVEGQREAGRRRRTGRQARGRESDYLLRRMRPLPRSSQSSETFSFVDSVIRKSACGVVPFSYRLTFC